MIKRIIISGASGTGKTMLGAEVAKRLDLFHMDLDDYSWRKNTLLPYTELHPREVYLAKVKADVEKHGGNFVMTGNIVSTLRDFANPLFDLAVLLTVPAEIRMERIKKRAFANFGDRVLEGGDMYGQHQEFYAFSRSYDTGENPSYNLGFHESWLGQLTCPALRLDGTKPIDENTEIIVGVAALGDPLQNWRNDI